MTASHQRSQASLPHDHAARSRAAFRVAIITAGVMAIIFAFSVYAASRTGDYWGVFIGGTLMVTALISAVLSRLRRPTFAIWLLLVVLMALTLALPFAIAGQGLLFGAVVIMLVTGIASQALPSRHAFWAAVASVGVALSALLLDLFGPAGRTASGDPTASNTLLVGLAVIYSAFIATRFTSFALRTKVIIAVTATTALAVLGFGALLTSRAQQVQSLLGGNLETTVRQDTEEFLEHRTEEEALAVDQALSDVAIDVSALAGQTGALLSRQSVLGTGDYWDARRKLARLADGQWGNSSLDVASVLVPSKVALTDAIVKELNAAMHLDFSAPGVLKANPNVVATYFINRDGITLYYPNINLAATVGDFDATTQTFYTIADPRNDPERKPVWTPPYQDPALTGLLVTVAAPVYDQSGHFRGVVAADVQLAKVAGDIAAIRFGETGYAFLIDDAGHMIVMPDQGFTDLGLTREDVPIGEAPRTTLLDQGPAGLRDAVRRMVAGESGLTTVTIGEDEHYLAFSRLPTTGFSLAILVRSDQVIAPYLAVRDQVDSESQSTQRAASLTFAIVLALAAVVSAGAARLLAAPLERLTQVARQIGEGNLSVEAPSGASDEIGTLASAFNTMTAQVRGLIGSLEERVAARTEQVRASADVGRAVASILDSDQLAREVVNVITDRFGFYYAAIFTLDAEGKSAVLRAATGEAGRILTARGHKLDVGGESMVGTVTLTRQPRVALDVGAEAVRFANPLLPDTRSEIALPLVVGERVIGALDVQSTQEAAFDESSVAVLQGMADQVAVALANAQSFSTVQASLQATTRLYELSRALFAAESPGDAYAALVLEQARLPGLDRLSIIRVAARDLDGRPAQYELAAGWDTTYSARLLPGEAYAPAEMPIAGLADQESVLVVRDASDPRLSAQTRGVLDQMGLKAAVVVPLLVRAQFEGFLLAAARRPLNLAEEDVRYLQAMTEQLAVVLSSLQSSEETRAAMERVALLNRRLSGEAWQAYLTARRGMHVESGRLDAQRTPNRLSAPIVVRGESLGMLDLEDADADRQWTDDELDLLNVVADEVALAIENARLIEQTQYRAARETELNRIAEKLRRAGDIESILRITAEELGRSLDTSHANVRIGPAAAVAGHRKGY